MGTSGNRESPQTPNWKFVRAVIGNKNVPEERQNEELWKAIYAERGERLEYELGSHILAKSCDIASESRDPISALKKYDDLLLAERTASLTYDMARRALARAVANGGGAQGFASEIFSELISYYASRDLPSYIGAAGRINSPKESLLLKEFLRKIARETVKRVGGLRSDPVGWKQYVRSALIALGHGRRA